VSEYEVVPQVKEFEPYSAGLSISEIKEKYGLSQVLKMASNENPLGTSPLAARSVSRYAEFAFRYPRSGNPRLCSELASFLNVGRESIVPGNGSDEIIDLLIRMLARPGKDNVCAFSPCFSIYALQSRLAGVEFRQAQLGGDMGFDWDKILARTDENTKIVFVTNPDNPSGFCLGAEEIVELSKRLPSRAILLVDEAYVEFTSDVKKVSLVSRVEALKNVVVTRTFSKMFGLAGLRLGYGVLPVELAEYMRRIRLPFSVNILAEEAGIAALRDEYFYQKTREVVLSGREFLSRELAGLGCRVWPSQSNFLMFTPPADAGHVFEELLARGIIIRPLKSYGLDESLRVSVGNQRENKLFVSALKEIIHG